MDLTKDVLDDLKNVAATWAHSFQMGNLCYVPNGYSILEDLLGQCGGLNSYPSFKKWYWNDFKDIEARAQRFRETSKILNQYLHDYGVVQNS